MTFAALPSLVTSGRLVLEARGGPYIRFPPCRSKRGTASVLLGSCQQLCSWDLASGLHWDVNGNVIGLPCSDQADPEQRAIL